MAADTEVKPQSNETEVDPWVITGAAMTGVKEGIKEVAENKAEFLKKTFELGDQHHIIHPLDDLAADAKGLISEISNKLETAYSTGDMNVNHSKSRQPHPLENTTSVIATTYETLAEKGPVEGTKEGVAMLAAGITETVISPSNKIKAIETVAEITSTVKTAESIKNALPLNTHDFEHLTLLPQLPSAERLAKMKELSDAGKDVKVVKMQMSSVPYGWITFGGGTAIAAEAALAHHEKEHADKIAQLPINEQKAIAFESGRSNDNAKAASLEKFPELKAAYQAYDEVVAEALKKYPGPSIDSNTFEGQYGGQSDASSKRSTYI